MNDLIAVLTAWISVTTGLPGSATLPDVQLTPPQLLSALRYQDATPQRHRPVMGLYVDSTATVHLPRTWDSRRIADVSVLVHELVHHLQNTAELTHECGASRERAAYRAQAQWLAMFGLTLESEFGIDALTLKLSTECLYP